MELRQLRYFVAVGRLSSITKAAEMLHTSQPNITTAIQKLENELGVPLFFRRQKRLYLTVEGERFLTQIEKALNQIRSAVSETMQSASYKKETIRIGIPPTIGAILFPTMLSRFSVAYPNIELMVVEEGTWGLTGKLDSGELDLGLIIINEVSPLLETIGLTRQEVMVCMPPNHCLQSKKTIRLTDLADQPLVLLGENSYHYHILIKMFNQLGIRPRVLLTSNQVETIKGLVANGAGISFLFHDLCNQEPGFIVRPFEVPIFVELGLAWKSGSLSAPARQFVEFFRQST